MPALRRWLQLTLVVVVFLDALFLPVLHLLVGAEAGRRALALTTALLLGRLVLQVVEHGRARR